MAKEKGMKRCALMDCEVDNDTPTLKDLLSDDDTFTKAVAQRYIERGFKYSDCFCINCWGK